MSLLRPLNAGRVLRASAPAIRTPFTALTTVRHNSQNSGIPVAKAMVESEAGESSIVNHEEAGATRLRHNQPNYASEVDQASS